METGAEEAGRIRGGFEDGVDFEPSTSASSSLNNNNGNHHVEETGEEDEDVCRICRISGDEENPLYYPCACSGSIKFVHQDCLLQWLNHSNAKQCEVCKHAFSFSPVYAENAPARLPFIEVLLGTAMKALRGLHFFFRLSFVLSVWLLLIPFITFWIWRLSFVRSLMEARKLFLSRISRNHISPALLLTDCLHGFLLSAGIVFIFLGATSMREYFRHLREIERQNPDREDEGVNRQNVERAGRRLLIRDVPHVAGGNGEGGRDGHENVGGGQAIRRNGQNAGADHLEMQARFEAAHVEQIFDGGDDADGVEDVPFDELVGMQGPVFHLVENAITVLASNMIFLGIVIFLPFHLGRIVLSIASQLAITTSGAILTSGLSGAAELSLGLVNSTLIMNGPNSASNISAATLANDGLAGNTSATMLQGEGTSSIITNGGSVDLLTEALLATLRLSDVATLSIGYISILFLVFAYLGIMALIRYSRGEPLTVGRIYGIASVAEAAPSLARQFLAGVKYFFTMVKVAFLLMVEIGIFPLLCGWWLDVCTISMLGTTLSQRVAFFWVSPVASSLFHWLVGIVYMLQISIFVSLLREVLRPGVLYFLRDPADPNYNPFRDLIDDPIHKHARRVLLSVVVYGSLIVLLVFLPVKLAMHLAPFMFPLDTSVSDPFTEIPADMLLFSICIPFAIEHFRPRATFKTVLFHWFSAVGWLLGLSDFLLPNPDDRDAQANAIADQGGQERQDIHQHGIQERNQYRLALPAGGNVGRTLHQNDGVASEENDGDDEEDSEECKFAVRIVLLLFGAWLTLLCLSSAMVVIPISLGRAMFAAIPRLPITHGIKCNDLYSFNIGCYTLWAVAAGVGYAVDYLRMHNFKVLLTNLIKWSIIVVKCCVLLSLWIIVIPVFIGLLFELLLVVPLRVPVDESPVFLLYQDWALGLIFLKIWTKLVLLGQMAPLTDESWRVKFEQVKADGFSRLRGLWVLREIVAPILIKLLTALTLPYVFARGLFPLLGYSLIVNSAVYRFAWAGCLVLGLLWYWMRRFQQWFMDLHNSIRDDRYLIGRRLHNFKKEPQSNTLQRNNNSSAQAVGDLSMEDPIGADGEDKIVPESIEQNQGFSSGSSSGPMEMGNLRHRKASTSNH